MLGSGNLSKQPVFGFTINQHYQNPSTRIGTIEEESKTNLGTGNGRKVRARTASAQPKEIIDVFVTFGKQHCKYWEVQRVRRSMDGRRRDAQFLKPVGRTIVGTTDKNSEKMEKGI